MKFTPIAAAVLAFAAAPAALAQQSTQQTAPTSNILKPLQGGGIHHINSGLDCPATLASFKFEKHTVYREDGSDIGCSYNDTTNNSKMDYYIFQRPESETVNDLAIGAARSINQAMKGLELDKMASQNCSIGVGTAMLQLKHVQGEATAPPCYVFTKENLSTLVTVWKRDNWNIKVRMTGPNSQITRATTSVYALSYQPHGQSVSTQPVSAPAAPAQPKPKPKPKSKGFSKADVDEFCAQSTTKTSAGMQFNGKKASAAVMEMTPGRYAYKDNGAMLYFADKSYLVRLPETREGIFGTDGDDMIAAGGLLAGCSGEQLSEVFERNKLDLNSFQLIKAF